MWRSTAIAKQFRPLGTPNRCYRALGQDHTPAFRNGDSIPSNRHRFNNETDNEQHSGNKIGLRGDRIGSLLRMLKELPDSKEAVYGTLDSWVAWEVNFPIGPLRKVLITLEKEGEWHRIIQVIKWILSKGQGTTMGIYGQLIRALDKDKRPDEAHEVWVKKVGTDLHSVPWQLCITIISIYYQNNMPERVVKLFKGLEQFDRKPTDKKTVQKVADAYELLGSVEEKERVLEKYKHLFTEAGTAKSKKREKYGQEKQGS